MKKLFFIFFLFILNTNPVYSHGGEDHGDEKIKEIVSTDINNSIKIYSTEYKEIIFKYNPFKINNLSKGLGKK